jgi:hypothetical protein
MLTYASGFISGDLNPFWPHFILLSLSVLASIVVAFGIIFESPKFEEATHRIAMWLVIVGVAIEAVCTICLFVFDEGISRRQNGEIIRLRQQVANRDLSEEETKTIAARLSVFAGQQVEISIYPVNFESNWISGKVYGLLLEARWNIGPPQQLSMPPNGLLVQGILIEATADPASQAAAKAAFEALKPTVASGLFHPSPLSNPEKPRVWIFIGDKPAPLRTWVAE